VLPLLLHYYYYYYFYSYYYYYYYHHQPTHLSPLRYELIKDVGTGTFGRVIVCWDRERGCEVAVKMVRRVPRYVESAMIEADILRDVNKRGSDGVGLVVRLFDDFKWQGHYVIVLEKLGMSLYDFLKGNDYAPFPARCVRDFARQLLQAMAWVHAMRLIHTDLKLENVLLVNSDDCVYEPRPPRGAFARDGDDAGAGGGSGGGRQVRVPCCTRIKIIDFGGATYEDAHKSKIINTRQ